MYVTTIELFPPTLLSLVNEYLSMNVIVIEQVPFAWVLLVEVKFQLKHIDKISSLNWLLLNRTSKHECFSFKGCIDSGKN